MPGASAFRYRVSSSRDKTNSRALSPLRSLISGTATIRFQNYAMRNRRRNVASSRFTEAGESVRPCRVCFAVRVRL